MMHCLSGAIPASVVGVSCIAAGIHSWLLDTLNALVAQTLFDLEELLGCLILLRVTGDTDGGVPSGTFRSQEVSIDLMLDRLNDVLSSLMIGVTVIIPPIEAGLVLGVIQLTVMD